MAMIHKCDRCGAIIENQKGYSLGGDITVTRICLGYDRPDYSPLYERKVTGHYRREFDLCDECLRKVIVYMMNDVDEFEPSENDHDILV